MAAPIAVQRAEYAFALDHFLQSRHHCRRRFLFHQLRVIDLARGVVQNHDQVVPPFILKPLVAAAVDVQQHPRQRPPLAPFAMHPALAPPRHQPRSLQRLLHPGVAQLDAMLSFQLLVKMLYVHVEILLPVEREYFLHGCQRHPPMRRLPSPPVHQTVVSLFLVALTPAPHVPVADPKDLGRLPPCNLFRHGLQHHVLYFHRPLHRGLRVRVHASHGLLPSPPEKRTYHLLSQPDISSATDITAEKVLSPEALRCIVLPARRSTSQECFDLRSPPASFVNLVERCALFAHGSNHHFYAKVRSCQHPNVATSRGRQWRNSPPSRLSRTTAASS